MDHFDENVTHPLLDEDESDSENMKSNVTVANNCKEGHKSIGVTMKKHTTTSLSQKIDDQLGYLSTYILELKDSNLQVDLESLEPEEIDGELFFKACAAQSSTEGSYDDLDLLKGYEKGTATWRKSSRSRKSSHKRKNHKNKSRPKGSRGQVRFLTVPTEDNVDGAEVSVDDEESQDTSEVGHHQNFVDDEGQSTGADEAMAEDVSTRGKPVEQFLEDDCHRLRGRQHLDYRGILCIRK